MWTNYWKANTMSNSTEQRWQENELISTLAERAEIFNIYCQSANEAKARLVEGSKVAREAGWSAQRIATAVGVSKRTIQVWTD